MSDMILCKGTGCPIKETCWRYIAPRHFCQSFITIPPYSREENSCEYYTMHHHHYRYVDDGDIGSGWFCTMCGIRKE